MKNLFLLFTILLTTLQSFAQQKEFIHDTITFEEPYEYLQIDTSSQNLWQIGEPSKIFFNSAYSVNNAIVTDTINNYPLNNYSYFDIKIGKFNYGYDYPFDVFIDIKHKFDTDTLKDGGFISVSYDEGITWYNIINDTLGNWEITPYNDPFQYGRYLYTENNTLFNGEYGFSGNSNDWITTTLAWYNIPVRNNISLIGDTMIVRFNFISDSLETNNEGWMIDNIKLYSVDLGSGIHDNNKLDFRISPNPFNETTIIELGDYRKIELSIFDIQGKLVSQNKYFNNQPITINKGKLNSGVYFLKIKTDNNFAGIKKLTIK